MKQLTEEQLRELLEEAYSRGWQIGRNPAYPLIWMPNNRKIVVDELMKKV